MKARVWREEKVCTEYVIDIPEIEDDLRLTNAVCQIALQEALAADPDYPGDVLYEFDFISDFEVLPDEPDTESE